MKRKKLQEAREKGLISPSSDWTLDSDGEPARRSDLVKYVYMFLNKVLALKLTTLIMMRKGFFLGGYDVVLFISNLVSESLGLKMIMTIMF